MSEIIAAVKALHALDIEHKDLKWDNFVIDAEGHLKLIDFGYAMRRTDITIAKLKNFHKTEQWWIVLDWYLVSEMLNELHIQENTLMLNPKKDNIIFAHQKDLVRKLCALDYHETVFNPIEDTKSIHQSNYTFYMRLLLLNMKQKIFYPQILRNMSFSMDLSNGELREH